MWWLIRGPWAVVKWIWAGIVLVGYVLWGLLNIMTWFDANETTYNNPYGAKPKTPPQEGEPDAERKAS
jgi:hypothetical protein